MSKRGLVFSSPHFAVSSLMLRKGAELLAGKCVAPAVTCIKIRIASLEFTVFACLVVFACGCIPTSVLLHFLGDAGSGRNHVWCSLGQFG